MAARARVKTFLMEAVTVAARTRAIREIAIARIRVASTDAQDVRTQDFVQTVMV